MRAKRPGLPLRVFILFLPALPFAGEGLFAPFPNPVLERYFQWGQYDSLALGVESRLQDSSGADAADMARLSAYRGVAFFSQGRRDEAERWFRHSFCRDSSPLLDPYYLTEDMLSLYRETRASTEGCKPPGEIAEAEKVLPPKQEPAPAGAILPSVASPSSSKKPWLMRGAFAAAVLLAAGSVWEFNREAETFAAMKKAAQSGEIEDYERRKPELAEHRRNVWIAAGGALAFTGAGTFLAWPRGKTRLSARILPEPYATLAWDF